VTLCDLCGSLCNKKSYTEAHRGAQRNTEIINICVVCVLVNNAGSKVATINAKSSQELGINKKFFKKSNIIYFFAFK